MFYQKNYEEVKSSPAVKVWLRDSVKVGVKFEKWVHFRVPKHVFFLDGKGQNSLSNHKQVMIGQHKSIEVVKIHWFCNSSLLLGKKIGHKTTKIPVLQKLTHMMFFFNFYCMLRHYHPLGRVPDHSGTIQTSTRHPQTPRNSPPFLVKNGPLGHWEKMQYN